MPLKEEVLNKLHIIYVVLPHCFEVKNDLHCYAFNSLQIIISLDRHELASCPTIGELMKKKLKLEDYPAAIFNSAMDWISLEGDAALIVDQHCGINVMLTVARTAEEVNLLLADTSGTEKK